MTAIFQANAEEFWRNGYLTAPLCSLADQLVQMRAEADRLLEMFSTNPERYPRRIQWEKNYLPCRRARRHGARHSQAGADLRPQPDLC